MAKTLLQKQSFSFGAASLSAIAGLGLGAGIAQSVPVLTTVLVEIPVAAFFLYHAYRFIKISFFTNW